MRGPSMFDAVDDEYLAPGEEPPPEFEEESSQTQEDALFEAALGASKSREGQLVSAPIVAIREDHVLVDLGEKSEGIIDIREFGPSAEGEEPHKVGDTIEVVVGGPDPESGLINLSYQEARKRKALVEVREAMEADRPVKGRVIRLVKGGLIVDLGTTAFLPASQVDLRRVDNFEEWIGREVEGLIIEYVPEKRRIIMSRRRLLEREREAARQEVMGHLAPGQMLDVTVKRIADFGVFVDLGGMDGLVPRSEISWQRNARPEELLNVGDQLQVKVLEINHERGKVTLSRRMARENPWEQVEQRYPVGTTIRGNVVSITGYGAFVRIEEGLDGMIHISDMAWDSANRKPGEYVAMGQEVEAQILNCDVDNRRISLGLKQLTQDPWEDIERTYPRGHRLRGKVTGLTKYGAFVELEPGIEGMVHVSDFSWEKRIVQPRDVVSKGDELDVCILDVDRNRRRISLGVKQLTDSPFALFTANHREGDVVEGEVTNLTEFGAFVKLADSVEGFMHVSQLDRERVKSPADALKIGETIKAKVLKIERDTGKISLSRKQMFKEEERKVVQSYMAKSNKGSLLSMGELLEDIVLEDDLPPEPKAPAHPEPPTPAATDEPPAAVAPLNEETVTGPAETAPALADDLPPAPETTETADGEPAETVEAPRAEAPPVEATTTEAADATPAVVPEASPGTAEAAAPVEEPAPSVETAEAPPAEAAPVEATTTEATAPAEAAAPVEEPASTVETAEAPPAEAAPVEATTTEAADAPPAVVPEATPGEPVAEESSEASAEALEPGPGSGREGEPHPDATTTDETQPQAGEGESSGERPQ